MKTIIQCFFSVVPLRFLPPLTRTVCNVQTKVTEIVPLEERELRETYAKSTAYRLNNYWIKVNFVGRNLEKLREQRVRDSHYRSIGELCVKFSNLEQHIKRLLRTGFDSDEKHEWKSGKSLIAAFIDATEKCPIDDVSKSMIIQFLDAYGLLAEKRNDALKAMYSYHTNDKKMVKLNDRVYSHPKAFNNESAEDLFKNAVSPFDEPSHKALITEVERVTALFAQIQGHLIRHYIMHSGIISPIDEYFESAGFKIKLE